VERGPLRASTVSGVLVVLVVVEEDEEEGF
jgi:hypothetical protein